MGESPLSLSDDLKVNIVQAQKTKNMKMSAIIITGKLAKSKASHLDVFSVEMILSFSV